MGLDLCVKSGDFAQLGVEVPFVKEDRILHYDIENSVAFLNSFLIDLED
ncbi:hypothetical protein [Flavobacterium sp.]